VVVDGRTKDWKERNGAGAERKERMDVVVVVVRRGTTASVGGGRERKIVRKGRLGDCYRSDSRR
jgi:hypothetical protein